MTELYAGEYPFVTLLARRGINVEVDTSRENEHATIQIDTTLTSDVESVSSATGAVKVMLNEHELWFGDPELDRAEFGPHDCGALLSVAISEDVAVWVLGYLDGGHEPGSFASALIEAIVHADVDNFTALSRGVPEWCAAVMMWRFDKAKLRELAGKS